MPRFNLSDTFSALKHPNFRLWFGGQIVSLIGTWMQSTAQGYLVYELTASPIMLGVVDAAKLVGADAGAGIGEGMAGADLSTDAATVATNTESALRGPGAFDSNSPANRTKPVGRDAAAGVGAGMSEYDLSSSAAAFAASAKSGLQTALGDGTIKTTGKNAMIGFALGILSGKSNVVTAIRIVARSAVKAAQDELIIQSPSRVFRDEVGVMAMRGLGEGVLQETKAQAKVVRNAARYLTDEAQMGVVPSGSYSDNRKTYNQNASTTLRVERLYVNDRQDVTALAIEIASVTRRKQRGKGQKV